MTGLRYSPSHVTEFCGEMQGKFKVSLADLARLINRRTQAFHYKIISKSLDDLAMPFCCRLMSLS